MPRRGKKVRMRGTNRAKILSLLFVHAISGLFFVATWRSHYSWPNLERNAETDMMIVDHPKAKYYSLQMTRIKKKESMDFF